MMSEDLASKFLFVTDDTIGSIVGRWEPVEDRDKVRLYFCPEGAVWEIVSFRE